jgi:hypothetical protein
MMKLQKLLKQHGHKVFKLDGEDKFGAFMLLDKYSVYLTKDDAILAQDLSLDEFYPLIRKLCHIGV